ncbi:hypothetical protein TNCV_377511 [Trichonephila clavipes]|nr:hypothetical protein TNCV_377511 [Trichonephila clavipes]
MSSRHHIDDLCVAKLLKDRRRAKNNRCCQEFDIAHSRLWKLFKTTGMCSRRHGGGCVRSTTLEKDRYIGLSAKRNRRSTAQQVANQFLAASEKQISLKTIARRLRGGGLYARRPVVCPIDQTAQSRPVFLKLWGVPPGGASISKIKDLKIISLLE